MKLFCKIVGCIALVGGSLSCAKEELDLANIGLESYNPTLAVPLIKSDLGIDRILTSSENQNPILIDPSGFVSLIYESDKYSFDLTDVVEFPTFSVGESIGNFVSTDLPVAAETTLTRTIAVSDTFDLGDIEINQLYFSDGLVNTALITSANNDAQVQVAVEIPSITKNTARAQFSVNTTSPTASYDLNNAILDLRANSSSENVIELEVDVEITYPLGSTIRTTDAFDVNFEIRGIDYQRLYCDLKQITIDLPPDSVIIDLFKGAGSEGDFRLVNPVFETDFTNNLGVEVEMEIEELYSRNTVTGKITDVNLTGMGNTFVVGAATTTGGLDPINPTTSTVSITTKDIAEIIMPTPQSVTQDLLAFLNPAVGQHFNFIDKDAVIDVVSRVIMPLEGFAPRFNLVDTVDFTFSDFFDEIQQLDLVVFTENGYPIDAKLQVYMADDNSNIIDSLFSTGRDFIVSANSGSDGRVDQATERTFHEVFVKVDQDKARNLQRSSRLIVDAFLSTEKSQEQKTIKIYNDYSLDLQIGVKVKSNFDFSSDSL